MEFSFKLTIMNIFEKLKNIIDPPYIKTESEILIYNIVNKLLESQSLTCEHIPYTDCYYLIDESIKCMISYDEIIITNSGNLFIKTKKPRQFHEELIDSITKTINNNIKEVDCIINDAEQQILNKL